MWLKTVVVVCLCVFSPLFSMALLRLHPQNNSLHAHQPFFGPEKQRALSFL